MKKAVLFFALVWLASAAAVADIGDALRGKRVGVQLGTTGDTLAGGVDGATVERYNKAGDAVQSLLRGKVDAVLIDEQPAAAFVASNPKLAVSDDGFEREEYAVAVAKRNRKLKSELNAAIAELKADGTLERVFKNHVGDEKGAYPVAGTQDCPNGKLKVATNATFPPYEFYENGKIAGIDIDLARLAAAKLGKCAVFEDMEFDAVVGAVQSGKADIGVAGMTVTPERLRNIDFTDSYASSKQVLVVLSGAAESGFSLIEKFKADFLRDARWRYLAAGLKTTLTVTFFAALIGIVLGSLIGVVRVSRDKNGSLPVLNFLCRVYLTVVRGTPAVIQLLIMYYVVFATADVNKTVVAALAFGLNSAAYVAEIVRSGILSVDNGQAEAGRSLGLSFAQTMRLVVLPQAFKNVLPALANEFIVLLKETSVCGYIGLMDLTRGGDVIRSVTYDAFLPLAAVALIYLFFVVVLAAGVSRLEKRLKRNER